MTVTLPTSYRAYAARLQEGRLEVEGMPCPR